MNIDLSVIKRRKEGAQSVISRLKSQGFSQTGEALNGRFVYLENNEGIGLTVAEGPAGTVIMPSGPVRGALFGENSVGFGIMRSGGATTSSGTTADSGSNSRGAAGENTFNV